MSTAPGARDGPATGQDWRGRWPRPAIIVVLAAVAAFGLVELSQLLRAATATERVLEPAAGLAVGALAGWLAHPVSRAAAGAKLGSRRGVAALALACLGLAAWHATTLLRYPELTVDEAWVSNWAWTQFGPGEAIHPALETAFRASSLGNCWASHLPLALAFHLAGGPSLEVGRGLMWVFACASLALTALVARRWYGPGAGLLAALVLAASAAFPWLSHSVREDSALAFGLVLALWVTTRGLTREHAGWMVVAGLLWSLTVELHLNGPLFAASAGVAVAAALGRHFWKSPLLGAFALGGLAYLPAYAVIHLGRDPSDFLGFMSFLTGVDHPLPATAGRALGALSAELGKYRDYYLHAYRPWRLAEATLFALALVAALLRRGRWDRFALAFLVTFTALSTLVLSAKWFYYVTHVTPLLAILSAPALRDLALAGRNAPGPLRRAAGATLAATLLLGTMITSVRLVRDERTWLRDGQIYDHAALKSWLDGRIPSGKRVFAHPTYWLFLTDTQYVSSYDPAYRHHLLGDSLTDSLVTYAPDYILEDRGLRGLLVDDGAFGERNVGGGFFHLPRDEYEHYVEGCYRILAVHRDGALGLIRLLGRQRRCSDPTLETREAGAS